MIPYLFLMLIPAAFAMLNTRRLSGALWYLTLAIYVLFIGLRVEVGPDWAPYAYVHESLQYMQLGDILVQAEPLSYLLFWVSQVYGYEMYLSNFVAALILITGVFCYARRTANPWIAVIAATPYFIIVMGMSGVRQAMAAGIILFLFSRWERYNLTSRLGFILFAALFHTSALVNNIFLIIKLNIALRYKIMLGVVVLALTLYVSFTVSFYAENMLRYQSRYLDTDFADKSLGSFFHIAMIAIPAFLGIAYRKRVQPHIHNQTLLTFGLYASITVLVLSFFFTTVASRLTVYLYFLPMMLYPALAASFGRRSVPLGNLAVIVFHIFLMTVWFQFANHAFAYEDYRNLLLE
jgi:hypothetical protein